MTADNIAEYPTIYALSSGRGTAGLAVLRLSGPRAFDLLEALTPGRERPPPRQLVRRDFLAPGDGEMLDQGMAVIFPAPASYTGEDVLELHVHGGRAVVDAMLTACGALAGLRMAEPGEFTRRAFQNGRLDLLAAEAVNDLIQAETSMQRRQAVGQLKGDLGQLYELWRGRLIEMLAHVEAEIDFSEEDLGEAPADAIRPKLRQLRHDMAEHLDDRGRGERLREGVSIAIVGAPNVGKSSLLNALAKRDVAIVSETAGTTRDVIEVHLDLAGLPVILADTAGLRETVDQIEDEGVRRALGRAEQADLKILMERADAPASSPPPAGFTADEDTVRVLNMIDLAPATADRKLRADGQALLSVKTGQGMDDFLAELTEQVAERFGRGESLWLTRRRHRDRVAGALAALERAGEADAVELLAEELRLAASELGRITGRVDVEDILDVVFADFCIGK